MDETAYRPRQSGKQEMSYNLEIEGLVHRKQELEVEVDRLRAERDELVETLQAIEGWSRAYPLAAFPEPDLKRAHQLLQAGGMTLDAISAHAMRHVITQVGKMARSAIAKGRAG
jgi:hypothetical protein